MTSKHDNNELAIVILAAGSSSRLGQPKQLIELGGDILLIRQLKLALSMAQHVTVVIGCEAHRYREMLGAWPVNVVENTHWHLGMGTSIACGVSAVEGADNAMILLVDQWQLSKQDLVKLWAAHRVGEQAVTVSCWPEAEQELSQDISQPKQPMQTKTEFGPPVVFSSSVFSELKLLQAKQGAKFVVAKLHAHTPSAVKKIAMPNAKADVDTPEQLKKLQTQRKA
ncbi:nucleotidyltransferase family protein [Thalassotalea euphylliae]|uniref:Nucleotidyltransferase family protein n=1 Tax=Thalassotalea euphylliae TaxID=1655234 RepID=A0A3E0TNH1_9GAMM|nr:nucleotidyltransferase family protein [Thalassotalea euphylliae]REL25973.1 nucleotidyltransferase family protein [Thalassotalea euphylliae]